VRLVDALVSGKSHSDVLEEIKNFRPSLIALYTSLDSMDNEFQLAKEIKEVSSAFLVFVGPWCSMDPEGILRKCPFVDGVVRREFEKPLYNLAKALEKGSGLGDVQELTWREGERIVNNLDGEFLTPQELDELPFVTSIYKKHLNIKNYRQTSLKYPFVDMFTARGCTWGKCIFCLWPFTIQKGACYRMRSIENVTQELKFIKKELPQVREVFFQDDTMPAGRLRMISEAILQNNLKLVWSTYARADLDLETMQLAKKAGCRFLHVGYESANDQILKNVNKGTSKEQMLKFSESAKKAGIKIHGDFIVGLPGETAETIKETIGFAKKINISDYQFVVPQPHPATPMYKLLKERGCLNERGEPTYPGLSYQDLQGWRFRAYRQIYFGPKYLLARLVDSFREPSEFLRLTKVALRGLPKVFTK